MKYLEIRRGLVLVAGFVALTSIGCGLGLVASVIQFPLVFLHDTPFRDYLIPGLMMAIIVGGSAFLAAALLLTEQALGTFASALAGLVLLGFEVVEVVSIDRNTGDLLPLVLALQSAYTLCGLIMLGGSVYLWRQARRSQPTGEAFRGVEGDRARFTAERQG